MTVKIRRANKKDLPYITKLIIEFKEYLARFEPKDLKPYSLKERPLNEIKKRVLKKLNNKKGRFLVAEDKGKIVGFVYGSIEVFKHLVFEPYKRGNIQHLWVSREYRNRGIGTRLKKEISDWLKKNKCEYSRLRVPYKNPARKLYKKWGFEDSREIMIKKL
jgi:ribosomal protein S18 acetylase RimI-like enzyme